MPSSFADSILRGAEEALAFARGEAEEADYRVWTAESSGIGLNRKRPRPFRTKAQNCQTLDDLS